MVGRLQRSDAQTFIDAVDEVRFHSPILEKYANRHMKGVGEPQFYAAGQEKVPEVSIQGMYRPRPASQIPAGAL